ncbi:PKD domain-containing protein [Agrococcus terreus]|uniref:PKD domain-containing protein n=1 Tax=Agrococcus terreus TaxID=574649 RepID=UPI00384F5E5A
MRSTTAALGSGRRARRAAAALLASVAALAMVVGAVVGGPPAPAAAVEPPLVAAVDPAASETVSADPLPTAQVDGVVWAQAVGNGRVFAGGQFANARPAGAEPGTQLVPRSNLLAYDLATGALDPGFAPQFNGRVLAAATSPDGSRLYVGGAFTAVNGLNRYRLAAFDTATGALLTSWSPGTNSTVHGIAATESTVYVVGQFGSVQNTTRTGVAALSATNGALLAFNPVFSGGNPRAVVVSPDRSKVVISGSFLTTNGSDSPGRGIAALDAATGASLPWAMNSVLRNAGSNSAMYSLASDGESVYGSGYDFGGTKTQDDFEGTFRASWADGTLIWMQDCHGDTYSVAPLDGTLYTSAHTHYCGNIGEFPQLDPWYLNHSLAFAHEPSGRAITPDIWGYRSFTGQPAAKLLHWYPIWATGSITGVGQASWSVVSSGGYLLYGGEFTGVSGSRQQGLVRFQVRESAPNDIGPTVQGGQWQLGASSFREGEARLSWQANHDADDATLTYELFRRGTAAPIHAEILATTYWTRPQMRFVDRDVQAGQAYEYRIRATDPSGNSTQSDWTPVTIAAPGSTPAYAASVLGDGPAHYWPLGEASGAAALDWAGASDLALSGSYTRAAAGQALDGSGAATAFGGTNGFGSTQTAETPPSALSVEAWFRTTSTSGGKIVGFGDRATGVSSSYDRHLYLSGDGRITWGVFPGATRVVQTGAGFNDGAWHHVVGTLGSTGMTLYVDGVRVGTRADTTSAQAYQGYWRVGGDNLGSWPNISQRYLAGSIADVAVYDRVLSRTEIDDHRVASGRASRIPAAPADAYGAAVRGLDPTLYWRLGEASGTTAADTGLDGVAGSYVQAGSNQIQRGQAGALAGVADTAVRLTSARTNNQWSSRQSVVSQRSMASPSAFAAETWFRTTSSGGGKLLGFGNSNGTGTNASTTYDRHIMLSGTGALTFGVRSGGVQRTITAPGTYRDGAWHHVVAQQSSTGMQLFVDGQLAASSAIATADSYTGYWRAGGDSTWIGDPFFVGTLDEVAVYPQALTAQQVQQHFDIGTQGAPDLPPTASFTAAVDGLDVAVDASASTDPEGPIASYAWSFGDGATASGATATHRYAAGGEHEIRLTVRDSAGNEATTTRTVAVVGPNAAPTASFEASVDQLGVALDASGSTDPDGQVVGWAWDFGDGTTGSGRTAAHDYAATGDYTIRLTVTDDRGGTASTERQVSVVAPNRAPDAAFTATTSGLTATLDATGSSDPDGSIASWSWDFGDGTTGSGRTTTHAYATDGTYAVTLTVVDDDGASDTATMSVRAGSPVPPGALAFDAFERSATGGWGSAQIGGAWTAVGGSAAFSVANGQGAIALAPSHTREARMALSSTSTVAEVEVSSSVASAGGTASATVIARQAGTSVYSARIRFEPNGVIRLYLLRDEVALGGVVLPQSHQPGMVVHVRVQAIGTSPTALGASAWVDGQPAPTGWMLQATDTTAALQAAGSVGIRAALSSASTTPQTVLRFDDWAVTPTP